MGEFTKGEQIIWRLYDKIASNGGKGATKSYLLSGLSKDGGAKARDKLAQIEQLIETARIVKRKVIDTSSHAQERLFTIRHAPEEISTTTLELTHVRSRLLRRIDMSAASGLSRSDARSAVGKHRNNINEILASLIRAGKVIEVREMRMDGPAKSTYFTERHAPKTNGIEEQRKAYLTQVVRDAGATGMSYRKLTGGKTKERRTMIAELIATGAIVSPGLNSTTYYTPENAPKELAK